jgi:hypothetical protein
MLSAVQYIDPLIPIPIRNLSDYSMTSQLYFVSVQHTGLWRWILSLDQRSFLAQFLSNAGPLSWNGVKGVHIPVRHYLQ